MDIVNSVVFLLILGGLLGLVIGIAAKLFAVHTDPRIGEVDELLPQANCGACGFAGCADFARALVAGEATPEMCPVSSPEDVQKIAAMLGLSLGERLEKVALIRCGGDNRLAKWNANYNGIMDCRSANLLGGGSKACTYGCLGFGTCARACPFDAIEITAQGLAVVHPDICTGCGKCLAACPRSLIVLVPKNAPLHNLCNNPEKGAQSRKVCTVSCIACQKCVKGADEGQMFMEEFVARVNYDNPPAAELAEACPTHCLQPSLLLRNTVPALQPQESNTEAKATAEAAAG
jgi:electron transport complex protein RnfB